MDSQKRISVWLPPMLVLLPAWYLLIRTLWSDWIIDPQYSYGLIVPLLVIGLFMRRWENRPPPQAIQGVGKVAVISLFFAATLVLSGVVPLAEANPDWRPVGVVASLAGVVLTLCFVTIEGGYSWLRHFAFAICFFLIAVPWPRNFEQGVMNPLMGWNTATTLDILHWVGFDAESQGTLIVLPSGILGIEEACSGIRSLQSGLMAALFLGEFFLLSWARRGFLIILAVAAALIGNVLRNATLALIASSSGIDAAASWHTGAGILVLFITFGTVSAAALICRGKGHSFKFSNVPSHKEPGRTPRAILFIASILLIGSLVLTELWFKAHEVSVSQHWNWDVRSRVGKRGVASVPIDSVTWRMLFYPKGFSEKWVAGKNSQGQVFFFEWPSGRTSAHAVLMHNPEVCLSNVGILLNAPLDTITYKVGNQQIVFNAWLFDDHGNPVYVFHTLIEQGARSHEVNLFKDNPLGRLRAALHGHRNHGQRMLEIAFWNMPSENDARQALLRYLNETIVQGVDNQSYR